MPPTRFPLNTLAIGFGLTGLAEVWTEATPALPRAVPQAFWAVAAIAWVWLITRTSCEADGATNR